MELTPRVLKAMATGVGLACAAFGIATLVKMVVAGPPRAHSADAGMMAGLAPLFYFIAAGTLLTGMGIVGALTVIAGAIALRLRSALAGGVAGGVLGGVVEWVAPLVYSPQPAPWVAFQWIGLPVVLGGFVAGLLAQERRRPATWRDTGGVSLADRWRGVQDAVDQRLPMDLRGPDWRNARERWPLLILLFTGVSIFTIALLLAVPDLVPWGDRAPLLARAINAGAMPWSKLATAWVHAKAGELEAFAPAALVGAGLGLNAAVLAGLLASLRRTVPVR